MGDWSSATYIFSQIFIVLCYVCIGWSYLTKNRSLILVLIILSSLTRGTSFGLLSAWAAVGTTVVAFLRDATSLLLLKIRNKKQAADNKHITKLDWALLIIWLAALAVITYFTADSFWAWFSCFATMTLTISIWQKNILVYIILGLIVPILWIVYCVYTQSVFGIICESIVFAVTAVGLFLYFRRKKKQTSVQQI